MRYACVVSGGCGGRHANGAGKREIERPPSCPVQSEGVIIPMRLFVFILSIYLAYLFH